MNLMKRKLFIVFLAISVLFFVGAFLYLLLTKTDKLRQVDMSSEESEKSNILSKLLDPLSTKTQTPNFGISVGSSLGLNFGSGLNIGTLLSYVMWNLSGSSTTQTFEEWNNKLGFLGSTGSGGGKGSHSSGGSGKSGSSGRKDGSGSSGSIGGTGGTSPFGSLAGGGTGSNGGNGSGGNGGSGGSGGSGGNGTSSGSGGTGSTGGTTGSGSGSSGTSSGTSSPGTTGNGGSGGTGTTSSPSGGTTTPSTSPGTGGSTTDPDSTPGGTTPPGESAYSFYVPPEYVNKAISSSRVLVISFTDKIVPVSLAVEYISDTSEIIPPELSGNTGSSSILKAWYEPKYADYPLDFFGVQLNKPEGAINYDRSLSPGDSWFIYEASDFIVYIIKRSPDATISEGKLFGIN